MNKQKRIKNLKRKNKYLTLKIKNLIKSNRNDTGVKTEINENPIAYYKYTSQKVFLLLLKNKTIKITNPLKFNDPMDSTVPTIEVNNDWIKKITNSIIKEQYPEYYNEFKSEFNEKFGSEFNKLKKEFEIINNKLMAEWPELISNFRVLSLTTKEKNLLMWSHYADEHKGVVIKFKQKSSLGNPIKVDYYNGYQSLNNFFKKTFAYIAIREMNNEISEKNIDNITNIMIKIMLNYFFMKMSEWSYENEYRIVYEKEHEKIKKINNNLDVLNISDEDIECVIIGASVSPLRIKRLKFVINKRFPNAQIKLFRREGWHLKSEQLN
ncbi:DUF2971 domain-containing protein [Proteus sp. G2669]|uniref:DUF2971 domain-containing protein n=1 Tax=Proteus sp. G2669 TaxID=2698881 RepID=UPI0014123345|nr:DUF2971 domain-containing protein [Proteus sp. G2669]NBM53214.1 DUF2971 domain-containing protein [Proteus sp. G2669]